MPDGVADHDGVRARQAFAWLRLALLPIIVVGEILDADGHLQRRAFAAVLAVVLVYALTTAVVSRRRRLPGWVDRAEGVLDVVFLAVLTYTSGGAFSPVRKAFFLLPLGACLRARPGLTLAWSVAAVTAYLITALPHPDASEPGGLRLIGTHALYLSWTGAAAVVLSRLLAQRQRAIQRLADERGQLITQTLGAQQRQDKHLAYALHDESVQNLLAAQLELKRAHRGDTDSLQRAQHVVQDTIAQLRGTIFDLHPHVLETVGLTAALEQIAERAAHTSGARVHLEVDVDAHDRDDEELAFHLGRELLTNAARHAHAHHIELRLHAVDGHLALEVQDDGHGLDDDHRRRALARGHIGLVACAERLRPLDGELSFESAPGGGTLVRALWPARRRTDVRAGS